jgi:hypothetical protein
MTIGSLFFMRFRDLMYSDDFNAGFYIQNPKPGKIIKISLYSDYIIPDYNNLEELVQILNESDHPGVSLFNYEIIKGRKSDKQFIIHAQSKYLSKDTYHILASESEGSPSPGAGSPGAESAEVDKYTFFHPREIYSKRLVDYFKSISKMFDEETLFLFAKTRDLLNGAVQDPSYWVEKKYWSFKNDQQYGFLPSIMDENSFALSDIKIFDGGFAIPENTPIFLTVNNLDGKVEFIWKLFNSTTGEEIIRVKSVPFFVWKFKDLGKYTIQLEVIDNKGNVFTNQIDKMINVLDKNQYIRIVENRLNQRKLQLLN